MTWAYRIAKKKDIEGKTRYSLVEAYMNEQGGIWGYTGHIDILQHIQHDAYDDDYQLLEDISSVLNLVLGDCLKPFIDEDTFIAAETDFDDELEAIKSDN